jgi:Mitochondrial carrier protein
MLNGCRLGFYEPLRQNVTTAIYGDATIQSFGVNIFSGASSGIIGAAAGSPFFLVKTRLQSYSAFLPVGTQHAYRNGWDGLRQIYRAEGVRGLYRGVGPAMVRTGFGSSVQLPTYFFAKRRLQQHLGFSDGPALHLASSTVSGFVVCCVMHPPDTVMSRMYNQTGNLYRGAFDCLIRTVRTEGLLAIYKGYFAHLARILPHTVSLAGVRPGLADGGRFSRSASRSRRTSSCAGSRRVLGTVTWRRPVEGSLFLFKHSAAQAVWSDGWRLIDRDISCCPNWSLAHDCAFSPSMDQGPG